jgi:Xaa-Pro aminopeptidase
VSRIDRLRERLERPLLVTNPVNVRYLTGLASSNAALLVERERVRLFTDFRYFERAQAVEGVEAVRTARDILGDLPGLVSEPIAFEARHLTYAAWDRLRADGVALEPAYGAVEALRAVKEPEEIEAIRRASAISDAAFGALADERFTGRSERDIAGGWSGCCASTAARACPSTRSSPQGRPVRARTPSSPTRRSRRARS